MESLGWLLGLWGDASQRDPAAASREMQEMLTRKLGPDAPVVLQGSFADALARARDAHHLLLVLLHSELHEDADAFVQNVLGDRTVGDALANGPFTFWAASALSGEGQRVARACSATEYPFLCALASSSPTADKHERVGVARGGRDRDALLRWLGVLSGRWGPRMQQRREEEAARAMDRLLKEEQERQYAAVQEADKRRLDEAEAKEAEERRKREEEEQRRRQEEEEEAEATLLTKALAMSVADSVKEDAQAAAARLLPEPPAPSAAEASSSSDTVALVRVSFPCGTVVERRFGAHEEQARLRDYCAVVLQRLGYEHFAGFRVVSPGPAGELLPEHDARSMKDAGLFPAARVVVALEDARPAEEVARESVRLARASRSGGEDSDDEEGGPDEDDEAAAASAASAGGGGDGDGDGSSAAAFRRAGRRLSEAN